MIHDWTHISGDDILIKKATVLQKLVAYTTVYYLAIKVALLLLKWYFAAELLLMCK